MSIGKFEQNFDHWMTTKMHTHTQIVVKLASLHVDHPKLDGTNNSTTSSNNRTSTTNTRGVLVPGGA